MGNPHAVIFVDEPDADLRALAESFGPSLETADRFPQPHQRRVRPRARASGEIDLVVWERGCGITLACGTGACATVVAACLEERLAPGARDPRPPARAARSASRSPKDYSGVRHARPGAHRVRGIDRRARR